MDRLLIIEPKYLIFKLELGKKYHASIQLKNVMHTMPVAFSVQMSAPARYTIKPTHGIIAPLEAAVVVITLNPQVQLPMFIPYSDDKFLVRSVVVPGGTQYDPVPLDWFTANRKHVYCDNGIRVLFIGGGILRTLVDAGCMEDAREVLELDETLVNSRDTHGSTPLHIAVTRKRPDLVQLLLEFRSDVNAKNTLGHTALQEAAIRGQALIAELLLARGAHVNARTLLGQTALHMAVAAGHLEVVKILVEKGADVNMMAGDGKTSLHMAVDEGRHDCLESLLQMGANVDARVKLNGDAPLHWAVERADNKAMEILLNHGACRELRNKNGVTPRDLAVEKGQQGFVFLDELVLGNEFRSGCRKGKVVDVQGSLRKGVMLDGEDERGWTALHRAAFKAHMGIVRTLLETGADVECKDDAGYTPLHCAAEAGNKHVVKLLLKHGALVNAQTCRGTTALDLASAFKYSGIVSLLLEWGGCSSKGSKGARGQRGSLRKGQDCVKEVGQDVKAGQKGWAERRPF